MFKQRNDDTAPLPLGYSMDDDYVPIVVTLSPNTIEALEVLSDDCTAEVALEVLAGHVRDGVRRPDSPQRAWVIEQLGGSWLKDMESDPDSPFEGAERPKRCGEWRAENQPAAGTSSEVRSATTLLKVTDYQDLGPSGVQCRPVFINTDYIVAMEPWGQKYKVFAGRSLEYIVDADDAARLGKLGAQRAVQSA